MHVIKRDGRRVEVAFDKITARIKKLSYGLHPEHCDRYVCANKNVFVFFLLLYLLGSVVYSKNEGWWRLTRRVLRRHEACARGLPSFKTFWRHSLLDSRLFQPRLFPNWRDIWRRYNNHERIEEAYGSFFFSILNHPRDFNALSVDGTFPIRVSSRVTLENTSMEDSFTFRGHFSFARWHANGEYEIFIFKNLNGQTAHSSTTSRVSKRLKKWEKRVVTDQILLSFTLK